MTRRRRVLINGIGVCGRCGGGGGVMAAGGAAGVVGVVVATGGAAGGGAGVMAAGGAAGIVGVVMPAVGAAGGADDSDAGGSVEFPAGRLLLGSSLCLGIAASTPSGQHSYLWAEPDSRRLSLIRHEPPGSFDSSCLSAAP